MSEVGAGRVYGVGEADRELVVKLIETLLPDAQVIAFGSRVAKRGKRYSDLDVAIDVGAPIAFERMGQLAERFAESRLPYRVDLSDLRALSPEFRAHVLASGQVWRNGREG